MFDVDDFRATNRDGGHEAGDDVLRRVAAVLAESVRLVDTVGRIGGDEFVLVAPGSAGMTVAQRVIDGIAALPAGRRAATISVSAGVARFPADGTDADELIAAATDGLALQRGTRAEGRRPTSRAGEPRRGRPPTGAGEPSAGGRGHARRDDRAGRGGRARGRLEGQRDRMTGRGLDRQAARLERRRSRRDRPSKPPSAHRDLVARRSPTPRRPGRPSSGRGRGWPASASPAGFIAARPAASAVCAGRSTAVSEPALAASRGRRRRRCWYCSAPLSWFWSSRFQPTERDDRDDRGDPQHPGDRRGLAAARQAPARPLVRSGRPRRGTGSAPSRPWPAPGPWTPPRQPPPRPPSAATAPRGRPRRPP